MSGAARVRELAAQPAPAEAEDWSYGRPLAEFLGNEEPDEDDSSDWHIRGIIARDVANIHGGDPKVGKTMMMESQAIALAMGADEWCGFPVYGRKRVLIMPREDSERTTRVRLWQLARGASLRSPHDLAPYLEVDPISPLNLTNAGMMEKLAAACERFDVVFVDSLTTAHTGDENSARDVAAAMEPVRNIAATTKTSIVLIHHFNGKGAPDDKRGVKHRLRGSSALPGYARHLVGVSHGPSKGQLVIASDGNLGTQIEKTVIQLRAGTNEKGKATLYYELIGKAAEAEAEARRDDVLMAAGEQPKGFASRNAIVKAVGGNRTAALGAIRRELEPGGELVEVGGRIYLRSLVPEPVGNQSEPGTGSGSAPYKGARKPPQQKPPSHWSESREDDE